MRSRAASLRDRTFRHRRDVDRYWRIVQSVPGRLRRSKRDEERYCLGLYLLALATHGLMKFPLRVEEGESPDFMLTASRQTTGLEVTKATEPWFQRTMTGVEREYDRRVRAANGGNEVEPVGTLLSDAGWTDGQAEEQWCRQIQDAVSRKLSKLESFRPALRHDLLVYDDTPLPAINRPKAVARLLPWLRSVKQNNPALGRVSVIASLDVLFDTGSSLRFLPFIDWSAPDRLDDFGDRVEFAGRKAVTSNVRALRNAGASTYSMDNGGRLLKHLPDGRTLEVSLASDGSEVILDET